MSATVQLPEENAASRLVYHSLRTRFKEGGLDTVFISHIHEDERADLLSAPKEDEPIYSFWITLPFPGGSYSLVFEEFADGSWAVFFEAFPSIIAGDNDSWEDALGSLVELVMDDLQDIIKIKNKHDPAVSIVLNYQKERHQFLKQVFSI